VECDAVCLLRRSVSVLKIEADLSEYLVHVYKKTTRHGYQQISLP